MHAATTDGKHGNIGGNIHTTYLEANMKKKKKIIKYLFVALFLAICFWYFNSLNSRNNEYDISQLGTSKTTGQFIPEQRTDYIFTTVEIETKSYGFIIFGLLIITVIFVLIRKKLREGKV